MTMSPPPRQVSPGQLRRPSCREPCRSEAPPPQEIVLRAARPEELLRGRGARARRAAIELAERGGAHLDHDGRLVGVHGLTLRPARHSFAHTGRTHWTWCAFNSVGIPAALGIDAEVRTTCPACHQAL